VGGKTLQVVGVRDDDADQPRVDRAGGCL